MYKQYTPTVGGEVRSRTLNSLAFLAVLVGCLLLGCSRNDSSRQPEPVLTGPTPRVTVPPTADAPAAADAIVTPPPGPLRFVDVAAKAGLHFSHRSPPTEQRHIHLFMGSGVGWLDFDRNGWPDLYCCQGAAYQLNSPKGPPPADALFANQNGGAFTDVARPANVAGAGYSMGVAAADYNNDGFLDLCVSGYGENHLLRNNGDGSFTHVALPRGRRPGRLSAGCAWGDIDQDGNLDLFITNYAQLGPDDYPTCEYTASSGVTIPISCHPSLLEALPDLLYRNTGSGDFEDISAQAGITSGAARSGLGVVAIDLDADHDIDFYVANDTTSNHLWENQGDGKFIERAADSGASRNRFGANEAGMGLVAGDFTGNGRLDLFVTNYLGESNTLYRNEGSLLFTDITDEMGLGAPSRSRLGFGTSLADFDNDGWPDVLVVNGHVQDRLHEVRLGEPFAQLPLLFHNNQGVRFQDVSAAAGDYFRTPRVARGAAVADFDGDHDLDVAINNLNGPGALLKNTLKNQQHWLQIELIGVSSNRSGVGAVLHLDLGDRSIVRCVQAGTGYLSCDDTTLLIGLGSAAGVRRLTVVWPGGRREVWDSLSVNRLWRLREGGGETETKPKATKPRADATGLQHDS